MDNKAWIQIILKLTDFLCLISLDSNQILFVTLREKKCPVSWFPEMAISQYPEKAKQLLPFKNIVEILAFIFIHSIKLS